MGIGLQFRSGRFDFSGGSIMLLGAIIAGNTAVRAGNNLLLMFVLCVGCCLALSMLVALFYVYARVPIIITTIALRCCMSPSPASYSTARASTSSPT